MAIRGVRYFFLSASFVVFSGCACRKPTNLSHARKHVVTYREKGCFKRELEQVVKKAERYFSRLPVTPRSTVVFDVDDTVISSYEHAKKIEFGYVPKLNHEWVLTADAPRIEPTSRLYHRLKELGYRIIFMTGRHANEREATLRNLRDIGIADFERLITRSSAEAHVSALDYKIGQRKLLAAEGYVIVGTVGDQWSDLKGPYAGKRFKIPNYMYIIK